MEDYLSLPVRQAKTPRVQAFLYPVSKYFSETHVNKIDIGSSYKRRPPIFMISLTLSISLLYLLLLIFFINKTFIIFINIIFISIVYSIIIHFLPYSSWTKKPKTFLDGGRSKTDWLLLLKRLY